MLEAQVTGMLPLRPLCAGSQLVADEGARLPDSQGTLAQDPRPDRHQVAVRQPDGVNDPDTTRAGSVSANAPLRKPSGVLVRTWWSRTGT